MLSSLMKVNIYGQRLLYSVHAQKSDIGQSVQEYLLRIYDLFMINTLIFAQSMKLPNEHTIQGQAFI
jgi:hypothetical protein